MKKKTKAERMVVKWREKPDNLERKRKWHEDRWAEEWESFKLAQ